MIKVIAFDLDDTLLDTSGMLAPVATREAFDTLIKAGLKLSHEECEKLRIEWIKEISHRDVFEKLALQHGNAETRTAAEIATQLFYEPRLPEKLPLLEGARENINYLKKKYAMYLVTAGTEDAQLRKAHALGIVDDFKEIFVVNSLMKRRKKSVFLEIIEKNKIQPHELLCIGNSLTSEIHDAIEIKAVSCYFEFGEERGRLAEDPLFKPTYHIKHHSELIKACRL